MILGFSGGGGGGENQPQQQPPGGSTTSRVNPQWSHHETREFIRIRAELERDFNAAKRNKTLWEGVSIKMKEKGYVRTPEQCKCKWKNLVNRYKGKETSDADNGRPCPFFEELHAVFTERAKNMQRLLDSEAGSLQATKRIKRMSREQSSDDFSEDEDDDADVGDDDRMVESNNLRKRKTGRERPVHSAVLGKSARPPITTNSSSIINNNVQEMLKEFFQQQLKIEMQWRQIMERHAQERQISEQEWRQTMEKLERERLMVEQAWREREEQRRMREEFRAERRDALLTSLLNKLIHDE